METIVALSRRRILSVMVLLMTAPALSPAQFHLRLSTYFSPVPRDAGGPPIECKVTFPCNKDNSQTQTPGKPSSKYTVALSWKASVSLKGPPDPGDGYNIYRFNPDGASSCTKINWDGLIMKTFYTDEFVELGKTYRYAARAFKASMEKPESECTSNVVEVSIPPT